MIFWSNSCNVFWYAFLLNLHLSWVFEISCFALRAVPKVNLWLTDWFRLRPSFSYAYSKKVYGCVEHDWRVPSCQRSNHIHNNEHNIWVQSPFVLVLLQFRISRIQVVSRVLYDPKHDNTLHHVASSTSRQNGHWNWQTCCPYASSRVEPCKAKVRDWQRAGKSKLQEWSSIGRRGFENGSGLRIVILTTGLREILSAEVSGRCMLTEWLSIAATGIGPVATRAKSCDCLTNVLFANSKSLGNSLSIIRRRRASKCF